MIGVYVTVPVACFRKGLAREYLETEPLPPPSTCYGFLLSLVGETDRCRHIGCRIAPVLIGRPEKSTILRTVWRTKSLTQGKGDAKRPQYMGDGNNRTPAQQELLTGAQLVLWVDSSDERESAPYLEQRVEDALTRPELIERFGGLSLGESTHLVDEAKLFLGSAEETGAIFVCSERGRLTLPVWVDHVGSKGTRYVTGDLRTVSLTSPDRRQLPQIEPP
ncbi:MAG: type I-MYXAN CRISPR-associated protein Cas5/Cmx5/DevS [Gemmatimonadetes bacterium]|nr:type I-MYXAN CRISPR-associated protein Cas5/Cmx5/DevS [Gemmatimonadota bacterium]MXY83172.1 type I-MYXAN CRISPR-associated protein Cas5/Cmx5/DevS [Gemmatimonadota bacterium]MYB70299.1 type I-MYXAN CRISPR-associated protein Cas5/Cmx5/DevS [Gemmatimonadota bacterium]